MDEPTTNSEGRPDSAQNRARVSAIVTDFLASPQNSGAEARDFTRIRIALEQRLALEFPVSDLGDALTYTEVGAFARDFGSVLLFNALHRPRFRAIPIEKRAIFLPHCLQDRKNCIAEQHAGFMRCAVCGCCEIGWLVELAVSFGYRADRIFIVGGGSVIPRIVKRESVEAVMGLACFVELASYLESYRTEEGPLPTQMVLLTKWGCHNTEFDAEFAKEVFSASIQSER